MSVGCIVRFLSFVKLHLFIVFTVHAYILYVFVFLFLLMYLKQKLTNTIKDFKACAIQNILDFTHSRFVH